MNISELRSNYHSRIARDILFVSGDESQGGHPSLADKENTMSVGLSWGIVNQIAQAPKHGSIPWQIAASRFEAATCDFLKQSFSLLRHIRPGEWRYECANTGSRSVLDSGQFTEIGHPSALNQALATANGSDSFVGPDIVVSRTPLADHAVDALGILRDDTAQNAVLTPLRSRNQTSMRSLDHAVISCKWTIQTERARGTMTGLFNPIRNREGNLPHIVAVTAEPMPSRIAALALGTGDLDCVYHFALNELMSAVADSPYLDAAELLQMMVDGKRLRDISDLPFDLAV